MFYKLPLVILTTQLIGRRYFYFYLIIKVQWFSTLYGLMGQRIDFISNSGLDGKDVLLEAYWSDSLR